jgi:hypothetical protein
MSSSDHYAKLTPEKYADYIEEFGGAKPRLTKRELFAMHMMAARRSNRGYDRIEDDSLARMAVHAADLLLAELAK